MVKVEVGRRTGAADWVGVLPESAEASVPGGGEGGAEGGGDVDGGPRDAHRSYGRAGRRTARRAWEAGVGGVVGGGCWHGWASGSSVRLGWQTWQKARERGGGMEERGSLSSSMVLMRSSKHGWQMTCMQGSTNAAGDGRSGGWGGGRPQSMQVRIRGRMGRGVEGEITSAGERAVVIGWGRRGAEGGGIGVPGGREARMREEVMVVWRWIG